MLYGDALIDLARVMDQARSEELARSMASGRNSADAVRRVVGRALVHTGERLLRPPARPSTS